MLKTMAHSTASSPRPQRSRGIWIALGVLLIGLLATAGWLAQRFLGTPGAVQPGFEAASPAPLASWPWPDAQPTTLHSGMTRWKAVGADGTVVELFRFDFKQNPHLRFGIYDQDEDDIKPFDNVVQYWARGVGQAVRQLNSQPGEILLATNGLFFGYLNKQFNFHGQAFHVAPVVIDGQAHYLKANHRWSFGVKYVNGKPHFKVFHLPDRAMLEREFDFGGGGAQCLVKDGKPLKLQPFPAPGATPLPQPVPSTPQEAGHIPLFDHMKTSRVSLAWPADSSALYWLFVKEPDSETGSAVALQRGLPIAGGWSVADVQRFWMALAKEGKIATAINSDAGDVAQMTYLRADGQYELIPPRWAGVNYEQRVFNSDFAQAPIGGAIMYFYMRDTAEGGNDGGVSSGTGGVNAANAVSPSGK
jgi:hypothetical protein